MKVVKHWKMALFGGAAVTLILAWVTWGGDILQGSETGPRHLAQVVTTDVVHSILASGTIEPARMVNVGAQVSGQIKRLHVGLGQSVRAGEVIAEIDSRPQENALRMAEAGLANIAAQRQGRLVTRRQAEANLERQTALLTGNSTSRSAHQKAEAELEIVVAEIAALDAQLDRARLEVESAQMSLDYTRIVAPIDGTVIAVVTKEGQTLNASQSAPTVVVIAQMDVMSVKVQISEADIADVQAGLPVWFSLMGRTEKRYAAKLDLVEPAPGTLLSRTTDHSQPTAPAAVYFGGLFMIPNTDGSLRPMMTAQVHIVIAEARGVTAVPTAALGVANDTEVRTVTVVTQTGDEEQRVIRIGLDDKLHTQILDGLQPGEQIVIPDPVAAPDRLPEVF